MNRFVEHHAMYLHLVPALRAFVSRGNPFVHDVHITVFLEELSSHDLPHSGRSSHVDPTSIFKCSIVDLAQLEDTGAK